MQKLTLALLVVAMLSINAGCVNSDKRKNEQPPLLPVLKLANVDTILSRDYVADIQAIRNVEVRARVTGYIDKILVDEGQRVRKGDLLFHLDSKEFSISVEQALSNVDAAKSEERIARVEKQRVQGLVMKKIISTSELELADAKLKLAQSTVRKAQALLSEAVNKLSYTEIRAPFSGLIARIPLKAGSLVNEGTLLTTLSDDQTVYAYFNVTENEYLRQQHTEKKVLTHGYAATLILSDGSVHTGSGIIETQSGEFNDNTGSIAFRAKFDNPNAVLRHGASGKVRITSRVNNTVLVPQKAVFEIQDRCYVYIVGKDNRVKMLGFQPQSRFADSYIVRSGLSAGDRLVCEGIQNISDGVLIRPREL